MKFQLDLNRAIIAAPAKINLFLELLYKRPDGLHELETVMSTVSLFDTLALTRRRDRQIGLTVSSAGLRASTILDVPEGADNLVYRAIERVREVAHAKSRLANIDLGVDVHLVKRIPSAAGLGGASSDAASAIMAVNRLWDAGLTIEQMTGIASELGSDIPFFLVGGTAICQGRGEIISPLHCPTGNWIVIAKPASGLSTAAVFSKVTFPPPATAKDTPPTASPTAWSAKSLTESLAGGNAAAIGRAMRNRMQEFAFSIYQQDGNAELLDVQREFSLLNCRGHQMSGSGTSYFGLFDGQRSARQAANRLISRLPNTDVFCCHTLGPHFEIAA